MVSDTLIKYKRNLEFFRLDVDNSLISQEYICNKMRKCPVISIYKKFCKILSAPVLQDFLKLYAGHDISRLKISSSTAHVLDAVILSENSSPPFIITTR